MWAEWCAEQHALSDMRPGRSCRRVVREVVGVARYKDQQAMALIGTHRLARDERVVGASVRALRRELAVLVAAMSGCGALLVLELATAISHR